MKIYLAGENGKKSILSKMNELEVKKINILESYYYLRNNEDFARLHKRFGSFLLDSGAFTFLSQNTKNRIDWDKYIEEYAKFINKFDIELFFELDIDSIVGIKEVERLRDKLEFLTHKKPIPVWHINRGKEYFEWMCKNYPYVALGGVVIKEIPIEKYEKLFPWFINEAHKNNSKIHCLGYTRVENLKYFHFDSVDSTAWIYGNRGGYLYHFDIKNQAMAQIKKPQNTRLKSREVALHNFCEWIKLVKYANDKY